MERDYKNYNGQTTFVPNIGSGELEEIFVICSYFGLSKASLNLRFDGWHNTKAFDEKQSPGAYFTRVFNPRSGQLDAVKTQHAATFESIETLALDFLSAPVADYEISNIEIDIGNLRLSVSAAHKGRNQNISRTVDTIEEFDSVKTENAAFVGTLLGFAWQYGAAADAFLRSLKAAV